jgi:hypothetical protein
LLQFSCIEEKRHSSALLGTWRDLTWLILEFDLTTYRGRVLDAVLEKHLHAFGAVEIAGTMWSGKT